MSRRRWFIVAALLIGVGGSLIAALGVDLALHRKFDEVAGLNRAGYRGPVVGAKQGKRVLVLGESTAFGYGVKWSEAWPAYLQQSLGIDVVNLAYNNEGAASYPFTLHSYAYLKPDLIIFYSGYNDLSLNTRSFREDSIIFKLTGYFPISPIIFAEKAMALRYGGDLDAAYRGTPTTFKPNLADRTSAAALESAVGISNALSAQFAHTPQEFPDPTDGICGPFWGRYCAEMGLSITKALRLAPVITVTQPYITPGHQQQQERFHDYVDQHFADQRVTTVNLGEGIVSLKDPTLCYDGMHLTADGNRRIAAALAPAVRVALQ